MLAIRMQRTGRRGHAMFRVIVQESRLTPTSGKVVARLGSYDPHSKAITLNKEKASFYLEHGAQPSDRVARLLKSEGVKLPGWVKLPADKERTVRNADKRRSTRPAVAAPAEAPAAEASEETAEVPEKPEIVTEPAADEPADKPEAEVSEPETAADAGKADDKAEAKPAEPGQSEDDTADNDAEKA